MRKYCAFLLALVVFTALFSACANNNGPGAAPSGSQAQETAPPDFSGVDFAGVWGISQVLDSFGNTVSEDKLREVGADYTIELLAGGMYIISSAEGKEIGQGQYSISNDRLTFSASGGETVYTIRDENTIQCTAEDGSVTIMTRRSAKTTEPGTAESDAAESDTAESDAE